MFTLGVVPPILLLIYIYKKDKREKEPMKLLLSCFICGIIIILPTIILETILGGVFEIFMTEGSVAYAIADGFIVAAFSEELFKYTALKLRTWKSPDYNCSFDGIVYAVFVSLGFATLENVFYIWDGGFSVAVTRMFTAIPGHASDAVFMGFFYSLAKKASITGDKALEKKYKRLALLVPIALHGLYDCLLSFEEEVVGESLVLLSLFIWLAFIVALYICTFKMVKKASENDMYFEPLEEAPKVVNVFALKPGSWICTCKNINAGNFCPQCGEKRPFVL